MDTKLVSRVIVSGMLATIMRVCLAPVERAKVLMQTHDFNDAKSDLKCNDLFQCLAKIAAVEGPFGWWKGVCSTIVGAWIVAVFSATLSPLIRKRLTEMIGNRGSSLGLTIVSTLIGAVIGSVSVFLSYPFEAAYIIIASRIGDESTVNSTLGAWQTTGMISIYSGLLVAVLGVFVQRFVSNFVYEKVGPLLSSFDPFTRKFVESQIQSVPSQLASDPLETIRRWSLLDAARVTGSHHLTSLGSASDIYSVGGISGFFAGSVATLFKSMIATGVNILNEDHVEPALRKALPA